MRYIKAALFGAALAVGVVGVGVGLVAGLVWLCQHTNGVVLCAGALALWGAFLGVMVARDQEEK